MQLGLEQERQAIDVVIELISTSEVKASDVFAVGKILLETIGGVKGEPSFNEELHTYALDRLTAVGPSDGAYAAIFAE